MKGFRLFLVSFIIVGPLLILHARLDKMAGRSGGYLDTMTSSRRSWCVFNRPSKGTYLPCNETKPLIIWLIPPCHRDDVSPLNWHSRNIVATEDGIACRACYS
ncbi:uncharacterized protein B0T23DRAFT_2970 [Neurospora hispaniola]|uniref:Uncharacterized protein n=1 Tax=Neurospora hispaniola TaxID=588809 RepID=A0AAJ0IED6_9PEZI|nr:hypothetical protein B0T23DRAFT_2970 [Neurospora hispaniola]